MQRSRAMGGTPYGDLVTLHLSARRAPEVDQDQRCIQKASLLSRPGLPGSDYVVAVLFAVAGEGGAVSGAAVAGRTLAAAAVAGAMAGRRAGFPARALCRGGDSRSWRALVADAGDAWHNDGVRAPAGGCHAARRTVGVYRAGAATAGPGHPVLPPPAQHHRRYGTGTAPDEPALPHPVAAGNCCRGDAPANGQRLALTIPGRPCQ